MKLVLLIASGIVIATIVATILSNRLVETVRAHLDLKMREQPGPLSFEELMMVNRFAQCVRALYRVARWYQYPYYWYLRRAGRQS
jgi:hypothetical protein